MKSSITINEVEFVVLKLPKRSSPSLDDFFREFDEELTPIVHRLFQKIGKEGALPNSFFEVTITLIPTQNKDSTRKWNYRPMYLIGVDTKILNELLTKRL